MDKPTLGIWKVKTVANTNPAVDYSMYQITRNDEPVGAPWTFKGQAVREKTRLLRAEGSAVRDHTLNSYKEDRK